MQVLFADALPKGPYDLALLAPQNGDISGMPAAHAGLVRDRHPEADQLARTHQLAHRNRGQDA